jgi:predicted dehydrogenase
MTNSRRKFLMKVTGGVGASLLSLPLLSSAAHGESSLWKESTNVQKPAKKLGVALVGLGKYSTEELAPSLQETSLCKLTGIVSGSPEKVGKWMKKYDIPEKNTYNYQNFDTIKDNPDIDIVYIVLPNSMHAEYAIRAAKAGKHVISEKPMGISVKQCEDMIAASKAAGKMLSIGYRLHFEPHHQTLMKLGQNGPYGKVKTITAKNAHSVEKNVWRIDKELSGGGPIMDLGIYCVQAAIYTLGEEPVAVTAKFGKKTDAEKFKEVEESISWKMEFPSGAVAECYSSYADTANIFRAEAEKGWFELKPSYEYKGIKGETSQGKMDISNVPQQARQMDDFADCILNNKPTRVPGEMGLRDVKILMAILDSASTGKRVTIS